MAPTTPPIQPLARKDEKRELKKAVEENKFAEGSADEKFESRSETKDESMEKVAGGDFQPRWTVFMDDLFEKYQDLWRTKEVAQSEARCGRLRQDELEAQMKELEEKVAVLKEDATTMGKYVEDLEKQADRLKSLVRGRRNQTKRANAFMEEMRKAARENEEESAEKEKELEKEYRRRTRRLMDEQLRFVQRLQEDSDRTRREQEELWHVTTERVREDCKRKVRRLEEDFEWKEQDLEEEIERRVAEGVKERLRAKQEKL